MIKIKNIFNLLVIFFLFILITYIVVDNINIYRRTTYICTISGSRKVTLEKFLSKETKILPSTLETWIRKNYDPEFKNDFVYRHSKTKPIFRGISRGSGGRGEPITDILYCLDDVVKTADKDTLTKLVKALIKKDKVKSQKVIDEILEILYENNGLNSLFSESQIHLRE